LVNSDDFSVNNADFFNRTDRFHGISVIFKKIGRIFKPWLGARFEKPFWRKKTKIVKTTPFVKKSIFSFV
jgi:hypothetical protein